MSKNVHAGGILKITRSQMKRVAITSLDDTLNDIRTKWPIFDDKSIGLVSELFTNNGFTVHYNGLTDGYIVLIDKKASISGIIIDALNGYKVVVMPQPDVSRDDDVVSYCLANINDYDIWPAADATRLSLFYSERQKRWMMATARAYDVSNLKWIGNLTYMEQFMETLYNIFAIRPIILDNYLDTNEVYCFLMSTPDFQPMYPAKYKLIQISGPDVNSSDQKIERYMPLPRANSCANADTMRNASRCAMHNYICSRGDVCNNGYILRPRNGVGRHAYLESSLHEFVRKMYYDIPSCVRGLTNETRSLYLHTRAYLMVVARNTYLMVFPHAKNIYDRMEFIIDVMVDLTINDMRANTSRTDIVNISAERNVIGGQLFGGDDEWARVIDMIRAVVHKQSTDIMHANIIGGFGIHVRANLRDYYTSIQHQMMYMDILRCE
jgi:hypothetical protein